MDGVVAPSTNQPSTTCESSNLASVRLLQHIREPQNLLTYLVLTGWMKFMGIASVIPTITLG